VQKYNTTCPFVEKVWNRSQQIAKNNYTVVIHGKPSHEETRATFSHAASNTPTVVVNDMKEAIELGKYINGEKDAAKFAAEFANRFSPGFDATKDLQRIGVVNQTTMLASDTQAISDYLKTVITNTYQLNSSNIEERFADTRDTLCYATNDNQSAVYGLLETEADLAIVVGGYNSSNTSHLVELCEEKLTTYYINAADKIIAANKIEHFNFHTKQTLTSFDFLPASTPLKILITSGASCPDAIVEAVIIKLAALVGSTTTVEELINEFE
jgi:4-hydroxy-3-methylbut-2-enyl diphosphate reductase